MFPFSKVLPGCSVFTSFLTIITFKTFYFKIISNLQKNCNNHANISHIFFAQMHQLLRFSPCMLFSLSLCMHEYVCVCVTHTVLVKITSDFHVVKSNDHFSALIQSAAPKVADNALLLETLHLASRIHLLLVLYLLATTSQSPLLSPFRYKNLLLLKGPGPTSLFNVHSLPTCTHPLSRH